MKSTEIEIVRVLNGIEARYGGARVGYAYYTIQSNRLELDDIWVDNRFGSQRRPFWLLRWFGCGFQRTNMRDKGIGTKLLNRVLQIASERGVLEVWGSITPSVLDETPGLEAWYTRHGFVVGESDAECVKGAVRKISKKLWV